jgi:stage III sporulation protein AA
MKSQSTSEGPHSLWGQALQVCPPDVRERVLGLPPAVIEGIEELRFRVHQPLQLCGSHFDCFLHRKEGTTDNPAEAFIVTSDHLERVLQVVTQSSLYAVEDELRRGFVTMPGGHRVGVGGRVVLYESGSVRSIRSISSLNIRVAKERKGVGEILRPFLYRKVDGKPQNTLIISPPGCGKTTLLRDLARLWSEGRMGANVPAAKVSIVDERSEIAGCVDGIPQFDLGPRVDVLDACPKAEGMLMAIRSLSPDIVVTDEIGRIDDRDAILEATHAGVGVLATAHARNLDEWKNRPYMGELFSTKAFSRFVLLSRRLGPGTVEQVLDANGRPLPFTPPVKQRMGSL